MNKFKTWFFVFFSAVLMAFSAYADQAKQVDFLLSGYTDPVSHKPLSGGMVWTYLDGTSTLATTWTDKDKGGVATNPVVLDSSGKAEIYGDNIYKFSIYDDGGALIEEITGLEYKVIPDTRSEVENVSSLRLIDGEYRDQLKYVVSFNTRGDGGGGEFVWDPTPRDVPNIDPDGGVYIAPSSDPTGLSGAWVRQFDGNNYKPEWYGGDVYKAQKYGDVILSGRTDYSISQTCDKGNNIIGSGIITFEGSTGYAITTSISSATERLEYAIFEGFELVGNPNADGGIQVSVAAFTTLRNIIIKDFTKNGVYGLSVDGTSNGTIGGSWEGMYEHILIRNCPNGVQLIGEPNENTFVRCSVGKLSGDGGKCWAFNGGDNVTLISCEADGRDDQNSFGFYFDGPTIAGYTLINPRAEKCKTGLSISDGAGYALINPQYFSNSTDENITVDLSRVNKIKANGYVSIREFFTEFQTMKFYLDTTNTGGSEEFTVYKNDDNSGSAVSIFTVDTDGKTGWTSNKSNTINVTGLSSVNVDNKSFIRLTASSPTTITGFTRASTQGVQEGHVLDIYLVDSNVTIAHGSDIRIGGSNITGEGQLIRMRCVGVFSGKPRFVSNLGQP